MAPKTTPKKDPRAWDALTPPLADWIIDSINSNGWGARMTPVQAAAIPLFRRNTDVVVEAVTGSGKTLSYLIPAIDKILKADESLKQHNVTGIIVSPTRELAQQIYDVLTTQILPFHPPSAEILPTLKEDEKRTLTKEPVVVPQLLIAGLTKPRADLSFFVRKSPNLLVATPGRLAELLASPLVKTSNLEVLIMDEADRLLDLGFKPQLNTILGYLPKQRRTGLFSASMSEAVSELIRAGLRNPQRIAVTVKSLKDGSIIEEVRHTRWWNSRSDYTNSLLRGKPQPPYASHTLCSNRLTSFPPWLNCWRKSPLGLPKVFFSSIHANRSGISQKFCPLLCRQVLN